VAMTRAKSVITTFVALVVNVWEGRKVQTAVDTRDRFD
jgi:hypothetical protein